MSTNVELLKMLESNARTDLDTMAAMLGMEKDEIEAEIKQYEEDKIILGHHTLVDWDKTEVNRVTGLIQVKVTPQRSFGFDKIAERIYQYDEVQSLYFVSGDFDLYVIVQCSNFKEIANFVSNHLSTIDGVRSTSTHFIMKKYKENYSIFEGIPEQEERVVFC